MLLLLMFISRGLSTTAVVPPLPFLVEWRPKKLTSRSEAFLDSCAGARRLLVPKWFVPGDVKTAGGKSYSPE
jgi:hypothetical protein